LYAYDLIHFRKKTGIFVPMS